MRNSTIARQSGTDNATPTVRHFVPFEAPQYIDKVKAICGRWIPKKEDQPGAEVTCDGCLAAIDEEAKTIEQLIANPPDRSQTVKHVPFDATQGYRPKERGQSPYFALAITLAKGYRDLVVRGGGR